MLSATRPIFKPRFNFGFNTPRPIPIPILPSQKTAWQRAVWNSDMPCSVKGFLQNLAVGWMDADGGSCYPSEEQIMERLGCSRPALSRWIRIAVAEGFLEVTHYGRGLKNRRYNYQATFPCAVPDGGIGKNLSDLPPEMGKNLSDHEPCPKDNHNQERAATPEPAGADLPPIGAHSDFASHREQEPTPKAPVIPLPSKTMLPDDWQLPEDWREWAGKQRPDLAGQMDSIASKFHDFHLSKATRSACWIAEWRRWINRERAVKPPQTASTATQSTNRYSSPDSKETPLSAAVKAALAQGEERRIEQLLAAGIDPATGNRIGQPTVATATQPPMAAAPSHAPIFVQQLTRDQQQRIIELAAAGVPLAEAKRRVAGGEVRG